MNLMDTRASDRPAVPLCGLYGEGRRILVAEDDDDMRALLASTLRQDGFEVIEARNGLELLDHVAPWLGGEEPPRPIDVIITDVQMPCFTGLEILAGLAEVRCRPSVILITAFGDHRTHADARALGAAATFDKPFDLDDLRTVLFHLAAPADPPAGLTGGY
ncbi:MAG: response regulator [Polyangiaceae bacterium]|nr:response regulator [Polyangiaceae bacterium]